MAQNNGSKFTPDLLDGLIKQNVVLMSGIVTAPVVIAATTFKKGVVIALAFSIISFLTITICSFVPQKIVYTIRVIIYALVASLLYIPTVLMLEEIFPLTVQLIGIYMPLLVTNSLIFSKTESRFYMRTKGIMIIDVMMYILGFDIICVIVGTLREIVCSGSFAGFRLTNFTISAFEAPFGGFILVGIMAGLFRALYNRLKKHLLEKHGIVVSHTANENSSGNAEQGELDSDKTQLYKETIAQTETEGENNG